MNTRLTALTLVTLATLATACDPELAPTDDELTFRGDELDIPPPTTGGILLGKGGHDLPLATLEIGYDRAELDIQVAFQQEIEKQAYEFVVQTFLDDERTIELCPGICEAQELSWYEGVEVHELRFELGSVRLAEDASGLHWESETSVTAQTSCGCEE
jgi:hypothetical protein